MLRQRTLKSLTKAVGVGLHSGQRVELTLRPAQPDTGIVFRRVDLPLPVDIPVSAQAVTDTRMASTISNGGAKVHTVEHLMSACAGLGWTTSTSTSPPKKCRSSTAPRRPSCSCCKAPASRSRTRRAASSACCGRWRSAKARARTSSGRGWIRTTATSWLRDRLRHRVVDSTGQRYEFDLSSGHYSRDIARARTFGFTKDVEMMRSKGLAWAAAWTTRS
jgi:UDP-3-O-[3-hydroxymyristoyl] N-acetylglucosamine deacetylase